MQFRHRLALAVFTTLLCFAQEEAGPAILRPVDESVVKPGTLSVVARIAGPSKLLLDGKAVTTKSPALNVLTSDVKLASGPHELTLESASGSRKIKVFATAEAAGPPGWSEFRSHPPAAACDTCHTIKEGAWALKGDTPAENCAACHGAEKFPEIHTHAVSVLEECQLCHDPHGSKAAFHLKFPKETACKLCHGL